MSDDPIQLGGHFFAAPLSPQPTLAARALPTESRDVQKGQADPEIMLTLRPSVRRAQTRRPRFGTAVPCYIPVGRPSREQLILMCLYIAS